MGIKESRTKGNGILIADEEPAYARVEIDIGTLKFDVFLCSRKGIAITITIYRVIVVI